tara:strand:+ start:3908 stop:5341 length:1434 start_codon:yes stop_codon:yes gene_type:complete
MVNKVKVKKNKKLNKNTKKSNFHELLREADDCFEALTSIYVDCCDYSLFLDEGRKGKENFLDYIEKQKDNKSDLNLPEFVNVLDNQQRFRRSKVNLYNSLTLYMWNTFEKHMFALIRQSFRSNKEFKHKYMIRFNEVDIKMKSSKSEGKASGIINSEYLSSSKAKQDEIALKHINEVVKQGGTLDSYHFLFDDGNWQTEEGKVIYDHFLEIRARRNLLAHRGNAIDKEYKDLCENHKINPILNKPESVASYYKNNFFQLHVLRKPGSKNQIEKPKIPKQLRIGDGVNCNFKYIQTVFDTLISLYFHYWTQVIQASILKDEEVGISMLIHPLMEASRETNTQLSLRISERLTKSFFSIYESKNCLEKIVHTDHINLLLITKELGVLNNDKDIKNKIIETQSYKSLDSSNSLDPLYKMALAFVRDDLSEGFDLLSSVKKDDISEVDMHEWYIFKDLKNKRRFKEIYKDKYKRPFKSLIK